MMTFTSFILTFLFGMLFSLLIDLYVFKKYRHKLAPWFTDTEADEPLEVEHVIAWADSIMNKPPFFTNPDDADALRRELDIAGAIIDADREYHHSRPYNEADFIGDILD